jgi:hypothetical protein
MNEFILVSVMNINIFTSVEKILLYVLMNIYGLHSAYASYTRKRMEEETIWTPQQIF